MHTQHTPQCRRETVVGDRSAFFDEHFPRLREAGHCIKSCCSILSMGLHDIYRPLSQPPQPALIDRHNLRVKRLRGTRADRGLPELTDLPAIECCDLECNKEVPFVQVRRDWVRFEAAASIKEEREALLAVLWNEGLGRPSSRCCTHMCTLFGTSPHTYYR